MQDYLKCMVAANEKTIYEANTVLRTPVHMMDMDQQGTLSRKHV